MTNEYRFLTRWRLQAELREVYDLVRNPLDYPRWWSSVYLQAHEIKPGNSRGIGRRIRFLTKGWLPYTLQWESTTVDVETPDLLAIRAAGDLEGEGVWLLEQDAGFVDVTFYWANKPILRHLSFICKPLFEANHRWAMEQGRRGLIRELALRRQTVRNITSLTAPEL